MSVVRNIQEELEAFCSLVKKVPTFLSLNHQQPFPKVSTLPELVVVYNRDYGTIDNDKLTESWHKVHNSVFYYFGML